MGKRKKNQMGGKRGRKQKKMKFLPGGIPSTQIQRHAIQIRLQFHAPLGTIDTLEGFCFATTEENIKLSELSAIDAVESNAVLRRKARGIKRMMRHYNKLQAVPYESTYPTTLQEDGYHSSPYDPVKGEMEPRFTYGGWKKLKAGPDGDMEEALAKRVLEHPVMALICHSTLFEEYKGDTVFKMQCERKAEPTHAVTVFGFGSDVKTNEEFWWIFNTWGVAWADGGIGRIRRGEHMLGIGQQCFYPVKVGEESDSFEI